MTEYFKIGEKAVPVRAVHVGMKAPNWRDEGSERWRVGHHVIGIYVDSTDKGRVISFDYWSALAMPNIKERKDLEMALVCFIEDCFYGSVSFDDFCIELGYDNDSIRARDSWLQCTEWHREINKYFNDDELQLFLDDYNDKE